MKDCDAFLARRRTVLSAAAWTVPVVMVASAAPAFAASGGNDLTMTMEFYPSLYWPAAAVQVRRRLTVTNHGPDATTGPVTVTVDTPGANNWHIIDTTDWMVLPSGTTSPTSWSLVDNTTSWSFTYADPIPAGATIVLVIKHAYISADGTFDQVARVSAANVSDDVDPTNNTAIATVTTDVDAPPWWDSYPVW